MFVHLAQKTQEKCDDYVLCMMSVSSPQCEYKANSLDLRAIIIVNRVLVHKH